MLLGTAKILSEMRDRIWGEVRFFFQHAEELSPGGGEELVEAGVMDGVDSIIGVHLWSQLPAGKIGITYGPMMAAPDIFEVTIRGAGTWQIPFSSLPTIGSARSASWRAWPRLRST